MLDFHKKIIDLQKKMQRNIANIYVRIFGKSTNFWHLVYICMIYLTLYVRFYNIRFNNNTDKISDNYVSTTGYLLHQINIVGSVKIANILCYLILNPIKIQLIITNDKYFQHLCYQIVYMSPVHWIEYMWK